MVSTPQFLVLSIAALLSLSALASGDAAPPSHKTCMNLETEERDGEVVVTGYTITTGDDCLGHGDPVVANHVPVQPRPSTAA